MGLGEFGNFQAGGNVQLPSHNNFLMTVILGVGVLQLINVIANVAIPFFNKKPAADAKITARNLEDLQFVGQNVWNGIKAFADKYE